MEQLPLLPKRWGENGLALKEMEVYATCRKQDKRFYKKPRNINMFIYDKPIETEKDDFLSRKRFSQHLGKALLDWKEKKVLSLRFMVNGDLENLQLLI